MVSLVLIRGLELGAEKIKKYALFFARYALGAYPYVSIFSYLALLIFFSRNTRQLVNITPLYTTRLPRKGTCMYTFSFIQNSIEIETET